jgi:cell wall-associated NlpC family hydrolase
VPAAGRGDAQFPAGQENPPADGAPLVTLRRGYSHHGIYVGDGKVVHYAGLCRAWHRGPVEEVLLEHLPKSRGVNQVGCLRPVFRRGSG